MIPNDTKLDTYLLMCVSFGAVFRNLDQDPNSDRFRRMSHYAMCVSIRQLAFIITGNRNSPIWMRCLEARDQNGLQNLQNKFKIAPDYHPDETTRCVDMRTSWHCYPKSRSRSESRSPSMSCATIKISSNVICSIVAGALSGQICEPDAPIYQQLNHERNIYRIYGSRK